MLSRWIAESANTYQQKVGTSKDSSIEPVVGEGANRALVCRCRLVGGWMEVAGVEARVSRQNGC